MKKFVFAFILFSVCGYGQLTGLLQWQNSIGSSPNLNYVANFVKSTSDGGYIIAGSTGTDLIVVKTDSFGNSEWQTLISSYYQNGANCIQQTLDGGYIVVGNVQNSVYGALPNFHGGTDIWIIKLTNSGAISWQKSLGGSDTDEGNSVKQTLDGGYIIAGSSRSIDGDVTTIHGDEDFWIIKLNSVGDIVWQKLLGGTTPTYPAYNYERANDIQLTSDGGYIVVGYTDSENSGLATGSHSIWYNNHQTYDYLIMKLNSIGTVEWQKCYGGIKDEKAKNVIQTLDGGFLVSGTAQSTEGDVPVDHLFSDAWLLKLNSTGNIEWQTSIENSSITEADSFNIDTPTSILQMADGSYYIGGYASLDFMLAKLDMEGNLIWREHYFDMNSAEIANSIDKTLDGGIIMAGYNYFTYDPSTIRKHIYLVKVKEVFLNVDNHLMQKPITISPIPASNTINIKTNAQLVGSSYLIYDQTGRVVINGEMNEENITINIENLSSGVYIFSADKINIRIVKN